MSRRQVPSYRLHKASGQAVVVLDGKSHYLGKFGTPDSKRAYRKAVHDWLRCKRRQSRDAARPEAAGVPAGPAPTVNELVLAYWRFAKARYVKNGRPTSEQSTVKQALRVLRRTCGEGLARDFRPRDLRRARDAMVGLGWCRRYVNKQVGRLKRVFAWAVEEELAPERVHRTLRCVQGLRRGQSAAREKPPVKPVPDADVLATLPHLPATVRAMVQVQRLCGGRPQDVLEMRPCDIDRSGDLWEYRPGRYKTEHLDGDRVLFLGPRAQELLRPYLEGAGPEEYLFSPLRSELARLTTRRREKGDRRAVDLAPRGKWTLRQKYDTDSYRRAVRRACLKAGVPQWCPLQLRHAAATEIRRLYGLEASQAVLGHAELGVTQVYAEVDMARARAVMEAIG